MEILEKLTQRELVNTECLIMKMCFKYVFMGARGNMPPMSTNNVFWLPRMVVLLNGHTLIDGKHLTGCYTGDLQLDMYI